ncbi:glycoside hydrolase family 25 protein [Hydnomerulius pinastri MD-312]|uniref:N,O-diacetylmuramidase n=1 Tax=Hydnomerulius pinastri MD-312 TaxID=994086 RepID=A0A0C9W2N9_9AGAM|nr:glycoside hydrolase family 25 protein [Hydnomerulius pinastri MD-312]
MKSFIAFTLLAALATLTGASPLEQRDNKPKGIDVSGFQSNVGWQSVKNSGVSFTYIKATEGTTYKNPSFGQQWSGASSAGLIRGSIHFAHPDSGTGSAQAQFFHSNGGGWSNDGKTLPGSLDIENNPSGNTCYGLHVGSMVKWITSFSNEYHSLTGRYPVIYTNTAWWKACTGNNGGFGNSNPLWIASYGSSPGALPNGWNAATFWQYANSGSIPGDQDYFSGDMNGLVELARG